MGDKYKETLFGKGSMEQCKKEGEDCCKVKNALDRAWETRNFEIELYWKRALYFWGFIASIFLAYAKVITGNSENESVAVLLALAGFVFSYAFYLANRGSKFWQENWEAHIDMLEADIEGNLYKTVMKPKKEKCCIPLSKVLSAKPYSVSGINAFLSIFLMGFWMVLLIMSYMRLHDYSNFEDMTKQVFQIIVPILFLNFLFLMPCYLRSSLGKRVTVYTADVRDCKFELKKGCDCKRC